MEANNEKENKCFCTLSFNWALLTLSTEAAILISTPSMEAAEGRVDIAETRRHDTTWG